MSTIVPVRLASIPGSTARVRRCGEIRFVRSFRLGGLEIQGVRWPDHLRQLDRDRPRGARGRPSHRGVPRFARNQVAHVAALFTATGQVHVKHRVKILALKPTQFAVGILQVDEQIALV